MATSFSASRAKHLWIFALVGLCALLINLYRMQVLRGDYYRSLSEKNRLRAIFLEGPRGVITDRNGKILAQNRLSFNCSAMVREAKKTFPKTSQVLAPLLDVQPEELQKNFKKRKPGIYNSVLLAEDISLEQAVQIEELSDRMPGVMVETRPRREYPLAEATAHLLGFIGPLNRDEIDELEDFGYRAQDWVGRDGVEKSYESYLRGRSGGVQMEVDSRGKPVRTLGVQEPQEGKPLMLTVDARLQKFVQNLLEGQRGAVMVMELEEGGILSINSSPSFDSNLFASERGRKDVGQYLTDSSAPMVDRAVRGQYPPGSIFKIITALAAIDKGRVTADTTFNCAGYSMFGGIRFGCWNEKGHGPQSMTEGFSHSCNVYFFNVGLLAGVDAIVEKAFLFGFSRLTQIDLPGEKPGFVPSKEWKRKTRKEGWYEGETANLSIGQGYLQVTPVQALVMIAAAATEGDVILPHVILKIGDVKVSEKRAKRVAVKEGSWKMVRDGLDAVVNSDTGTGRLSKVPGLHIAGKTGTAQSGQDKTHAWFVGFAPFDRPKVAVVVFLENGGRGGVAAARLASAVFGQLKEMAYV